MADRSFRKKRRGGSLAVLLCLLVLACFGGGGDGDPTASTAREPVVSTFTVDDDRLAYDVLGDGCPVVLVAGGSGMDRRQWHELTAPLAEEHRVVRYDPRGVGASDLPTASYSDEEDLGHLLDHLGLERAILVGVSSAGGLALGYAVDHPDRVLAVVASAPFVPGFEFSAEMQERLGRLGSAAREGREPYLDAMLEDSHFLPAPRRPAIRDVARRNMAENYDKSLQIDFSLIRELEPPLIGRLEEVSVPVLLVAGALDHPEVHRRQSSFHARLPDSRSVVIEGAGHNPQLESPDGLLDALEPFLERHCRR